MQLPRFCFRWILRGARPGLRIMLEHWACRFRSEVTMAHAFEIQPLMFNGEGGVQPEWYDDLRADSEGRLKDLFVEEFQVFRYGG